MKKLMIGALIALAPVAVSAAEMKEYTLTIKDHYFTPETLKIPADEKVKLTISNEDATPEEFESHDLRREKVIQGHTKGVVLIGPLKAGEYNYVGEFNEDTAKGQIIAE